jgi:hypothetical protein
MEYRLGKESGMELNQECTEFRQAFGIPDSVDLHDYIIVVTHYLPVGTGTEALDAYQWYARLLDEMENGI